MLCSSRTVGTRQSEWPERVDALAASNAFSCVMRGSVSTAHIRPVLLSVMVWPSGDSVYLLVMISP